MKGSAKIELRDAKSGRLVKQVEKHNIVTNGALNAMRAILLGGDYSELDEYTSSLIERYFGGILLFGASIDEDINNTIPSAEVRASYIGHASCFRTITGDSLMGTYVAGESSIGTHNATLVFSFDTSQANGSINCICLTSALGGVFGYGVTTLTSSDAQHNIVGSFKTFSSSRFGDYDGSSLVAFKDNKSYCYLSDNRMKVSDFSVAKNLGLNMGLKGEGASKYLAASVAEEPTETHFSHGDEIGGDAEYWSLDIDRVVLQATGKATKEKNTVEFEVIEAGETVSSKITLDYTAMAKDYKQKTGKDYVYLFNGSSENWGLFKNYALTLDWEDEYLCIANISKGTYAVKPLEDKALIKVPNFKSFVNILGTIYLEGRHEEIKDLKLYYRVNLDTAEVADIPEFSSKDTRYLKVHTTLDPDMTPIINTGIYSGYLFPYLATINNVDTLEKNASRTLKITYNLEY